MGFRSVGGATPTSGSQVSQGFYNAATNTPDLDVAPSGIDHGFSYEVSADGDFFTEAVVAGDVLTANQDDPTLLTHWTRTNKNIDDVAFAANVAHVAGDGSDHANVAANTVKTVLLTRETTVAGAILELFEGTDNGVNKIIIQAPAAITSNRTITIPDANVNLGDIATNTAHISADGSSHTFINQNVTTTGTPTFTSVMLAGGSAVSCALQVDQTGTGLFQSGPGVLNFATSGVERGSFSATAFTSTVQFKGIDGSTSAPGISFASQASSGMFLRNPNQVVLAAGALDVLEIFNTQIKALRKFIIIDGTAAAPGLSFDVSLTDGFFSPGSGQVGITTVGAQRWKVTSTVVLQNVSTIMSGTGYLTIPAGTTAQRPTPANAMIRYNNDNAKFEGREGGAWVDFLTSGVGASTTGSEAISELTIADGQILAFVN